MDEVWNMEQDFWLEGASFYERHLDPECIMAFPRPAGIMDRLAILESLRDAPRWESAVMTGRVEASPASGLAIVAYEVEARRGGDAPYRATCLSTYRNDGGHWLMTSHQQTPDAAA